MQPTDIVLKTYSNDGLHVLRNIYVELTHNDKTYNPLKLFVLEGNGVNLVVRSWLSDIHLDWNSRLRRSQDGERNDIIDRRLGLLLREHALINLVR